MVVKYPSTSVPLWLLWQLFGYVMEAHLHTHEGEERHSDRQKSPANALSWLLPSAHQRPIFPKPKGPQGHSVRPGNQIRGFEEGTPLGATAWAVPREPLSRCETREDESNLEHFSNWGGVAPWGCGTHYGCRGRAAWDCTRLITGCPGEEPRVGKGMELVDLGRNKCGKTEE